MLRNLYKDTHLNNTTSIDQVQDLIKTTPYVTPEVQNRWDNALGDDEKADMDGQAILLAIQKRPGQTLSKWTKIKTRRAWMLPLHANAPS